MAVFESRLGESAPLAVVSWPTVSVELTQVGDELVASHHSVVVSHGLEVPLSMESNLGIHQHRLLGRANM